MALLRSQSSLPGESFSSSFWGTFLFFISSSGYVCVSLRVSLMSYFLKYLAKCWMFFYYDSSFEFFSFSFPFFFLVSPPPLPPSPRFSLPLSFLSIISMFSLFYYQCSILARVSKNRFWLLIPICFRVVTRFICSRFALTTGSYTFVVLHISSAQITKSTTIS